MKMWKRKMKALRVVLLIFCCCCFVVLIFFLRFCFGVCLSSLLFLVFVCFKLLWLVFWSSLVCYLSSLVIFFYFFSPFLLRSLFIFFGCFLFQFSSFSINTVFLFFYHIFFISFPLYLYFTLCYKSSVLLSSSSLVYFFILLLLLYLALFLAVPSILLFGLHLFIRVSFPCLVLQYFVCFNIALFSHFIICFSFFLPFLFKLSVLLFLLFILLCFIVSF